MEQLNQKEPKRLHESTEREMKTKFQKTETEEMECTKQNENIYDPTIKIKENEDKIEYQKAMKLESQSKQEQSTKILEELAYNKNHPPSILKLFLMRQSENEDNKKVNLENLKPLFGWFYDKTKEKNCKNFHFYNLALCYLHGIGTERNNTLAFENFKKSADQGNSEAQFNLALCYENGIGVKKNFQLTINFLQLSASEGNSNAQFKLANCYLKGQETKKNEEFAFNYYKLSADQGNSEAQFNCGCCYKEGIGTKKIPKLAFKYFQLASNRGNIKAQNNLGICYRYGQGVEKNHELAFNLFKKSAEKGNFEAKINLALCYKNGIGVRKNPIVAFNDFAKENNLKAKMNLALCYLNGIGIEKNIEKALSYFFSLYSCSEAKNALGFCFFQGIGVQKNIELAFEYFKKSADQGNSEAQFNLAICYFNGIGVRKNSILAFENFKLSADQGNSEAQFNLAICYLNEIGVERSFEKAFDYCKLSTNQGNLKAQFNLAFFYSDIKIENPFQFISKCDRNSINQEIQNNFDCFCGNQLSNENELRNSSYSFDERGIEKDSELALNIFKQLAKQGNSDAQNNLACFYYSMNIQKIERFFRSKKDPNILQSFSLTTNLNSNLSSSNNLFSSSETNLNSSNNFFQPLSQENPFLGLYPTVNIKQEYQNDNNNYNNNIELSENNDYFGVLRNEENINEEGLFFPFSINSQFELLENNNEQEFFNNQRNLNNSQNLSLTTNLNSNLSSSNNLFSSSETNLNSSNNFFQSPPQQNSFLGLHPTVNIKQEYQNDNNNYNNNNNFIDYFPVEKKKKDNSSFNSVKENKTKEISEEKLCFQKLERSLVNFLNENENKISLSGIYNFYWLKNTSQNFIVPSSYNSFDPKSQEETEKINKQVFENFKKSADQGNFQAQLNLAICYLNGIGVEKNDNLTFEYFKLSADQGIQPKAQFEVAVHYQTEALIWEQELKDFRDKLRSKNENNKFLSKKYSIFHSQNLLDVEHTEKFYMDNKNEWKEYEKKEDFQSLKLKADKENNSKAQFQVANCYLEGQGAEKDMNLFLHYLQLSADQKNLRALYQFALCYSEGIGVKKNLLLVSEYFRLITDQIIKKKIEYKKNLSFAFQYFKLSADQGNLGSQFKVANFYKKGLGIEKNLNLAFKYFKLSADQGNSKAQFEVANSYERGLVVEKNYELALNYFQLAKAGHKNARQVLKGFEAKRKAIDLAFKNFVLNFNPIL